MSSPLDRQATCPSCYAPITFEFAGARSKVCEYCQTVVARTDRGLHATGKMADLIEIPSPLTKGATGTWGGQQMEVEGRIQLDRVGVASAPWQEFLIGFPMAGSHTWVAKAQGRWYTTNEVALQGPPPPFESLRPGGNVDLGQFGQWSVAEIGQRKVISGEGSLTNVPAPGVVTRFADIGGPGGQFGTIDYGDGSAAPTLYLGRQFDPSEIQLDSGMPMEPAEAKVQECTCPNCHGSLPIVSQTSERVVCKYCGMASDIRQGTLSALGPAPKPPVERYIPLGAQGTLRGLNVIVVGFVVRSCMVDGVRYPWREYLLYGGESAGYRWLMEEDGKWTFVEPVEAGNVMDSGNSAMFNGAAYSFKQQVQANIDCVIGEFYWKVEIGESVEATEFEGPGGKVSREKTATEVNYSFCSPLDPQELAGLGVTPPSGSATNFGGGGDDGTGCGNIATTIIVIIVICLVLSLMLGGACGGGGGSYGSSGGWSK